MRNIFVIAIFVLTLFICVPGAYSTAKSTSGGLWNTAGTWSPSGVPTSGDPVTINSGANVTVDTAAVCASITFATGPTAATIVTISGTNSLTFTGALTFVTPGNSGTELVAVGTGTLTAGSIAIVSGSGQKTSTVTVSTGTITVSGDITFSGTAGNAILQFTGAGTLNVGGSSGIGTGGTLTTFAGSTVNYNRAGAQSSIGPYAYANLTLSGSGAKTFPAGTTTVSGILSMQGTATSIVTGTLTPQSASTLQYKGSAAQTTSGECITPWPGSGGIDIENAGGVTLGAAKSIGTNPLTIGGTISNSVFNDGGYQLTCTGTLNLTSGTFKLGSAGTATTWPAFGTRNISSGTTVEYAAGVAQTVSTTPTYQNLNFSGAGTKTTTTGAVTVGGNWDVTTGTASLAANNTNVTVTGNITGSGPVRSGSGTIKLAGNWTNNGTFTCGTGTVEYTNTAGGQTVASLTYNNLFLDNSSGTDTAGGNVTIGAKLTTTAGGTLNMGTNTLGGTPSTITNNGTIRTQNTSGTPVPTGKTWGGTGTVSFDAATGTQTIGGNNTFYGLTSGGSGELDITGTNTINTFTITNPKTIKLTAVTTQTVTNFSANGSSGNIITIESATSSPHFLTKSGGGTISCDYLSIYNSTASPANTWYAGNSVNGGGNSGWIFLTSEVYVSTTGLDTNDGTVGSPLKTIAFALTNVAAGGTVKAFGGTYNENNINWPNTNNITLKASLETSPVTIDAQHAVTFNVTNAVNMTVEGITIQNGWDAATQGNGAAFTFTQYNTKLWFIDSTIQNCTAEHGYGAILYSPSPTVEVYVQNCVFQNNKVARGIFLNGTCNISSSEFRNTTGAILDGENSGTLVAWPLWKMSGCTIESNNGNGNGFLFCRASLQADKCYIKDNITSIMFYGVSTTATNCVFSNNDGSANSIGMFLSAWSSRVDLYNCTFYKNTNNGAVGSGSIVYDGDFSAKNTIFYGNTDPLFRYNSYNVTYSDIQSGSYLAGTGNIIADPFFVSAEGGDFKLMSASLCNNAGTFEGAPTTDAAGVSRPQPAGDAHANFDMGAYEQSGTSRTTEVWVSTAGSDTAGDGTINNPLRTIAYGLSNALAGGTVKVSGGTYNEHDIIWPPTNNITLKASLETSLVTMDAGGAGRCIYVATAVNLTIEGIIITKGKVNTKHGGGIYLSSGSHLWLERVTVMNCSAEAGYSGGAIYANDSSVSAQKCLFKSNKAYDGIGGVTYGGTWEAVNCVFIDNSAAWGAVAENDIGGGTPGSSRWTAINCTYIKNTATSYGIVADFLSDWTGSNCIFAYNNGTDNILINATTTSSVKYSDMVPASQFIAGTGNISVEPQFISSSEPYNLHLPAGSGCVDKGTSEGAPADDFDGVSRTGGTGYDMGAYEFALQAPPVVTVEAPDGGQTWEVNSLHDISWTVTADAGIGHVNIHYTTNEGLSWVSITSDAANISPYSNWTSSIASDKYKIRVQAVDINGNIGTDESNATFTFYKKGNAQGCVLWNKMSSISDIQNSGVGPGGIIVGTVTFEPCKFGNGVRSDAETNGGYVTFESLGLQNKGCIELWIKPTVSSSTGTGIDSLFGLYYGNYDRIMLILNYTLYNPSSVWYYISSTGQTAIDIKYPMTWNAGELIHLALSWDNDKIDGTNRAILYVNGVPVSYSTGNITLADKLAYNGALCLYWDGVHKDYHSEQTLVDLKVYDYAKTDFSDRFYEDFETDPPTVEVLTPSATGISLDAGSTYKITWTATDESGIKSIAIRYSTGESYAWIDIVTDEVNDPGTSSGSYEWTVPNVSSTKCKISIEATDTVGTNSFDISDNFFEIRTLPLVTVEAPNGGEKLTKGGTYEIRWYASHDSGITNIKLWYSSGESYGWISIATNESNDGSYLWSVPDLRTTTAKVSIEATSGQGVKGYDESNSDFSIYLSDAYVSTTGSDDAGDGSSGNPYATIKKGLDNVGENGKVLLFGGTYDQYDIDWPNTNLITLKPSTETAVCTIDAGENGRIILVSNTLNLTIEGVTMQHGKLSGGSQFGACIMLNTGNSVLWLNDVTIDLCSDESGSGRGGAIYCSDNTSKVIASDSKFSNCFAKYGGVGFRGDWKATNCRFLTNSSSSDGGVLHCNAGGNLEATNCIFNSNSSLNSGCFASVASISLKNCTLYGNSATSGDSIQQNSSMTSVNSIFWGNSSTITLGSATYSDIQTGGWVGGTGNISLEPSFVSTSEGNLKLLGGSPCIDKGTASGAPASDIDGNVRPHGFGFDMGAYEFQGPSISIEAPNGGERIKMGSTYEIKWDSSFEAAITNVALWYSSGESYSWISITAEETNDGLYMWTVPDIISDTMKISIEATDSNGLKNYGKSMSYFSTGTGEVYVSLDGSDETGNGSVGNPYATIQKGLDKVMSDGTVYVFSGTYTATGDYNILWPNANNITLKPSDETSVVTLDAGGVDRLISVGYTVNLTIESITLQNGGKEETDGNGAGIVLGANNINMWLESVIISDCHGTGTESQGGGVYCGSLSDTVYANNCTFYSNQAMGGGAAAGGTWYPTNCKFILNHTVVLQYGGAIYNGSWYPVNCIFYGNSADYGGVVEGLSNTIFVATNCAFVSNHASTEGAVAEYMFSKFKAFNCVFWNNNLFDGHLFYDTSPTLVNCDVQSDGWTLGTSFAPRTMTSIECFSGDPLFKTYTYTDPNFLHLGAGSPCIDTGTLTGAPSSDIDGFPRPHGYGYDIGPHEWPGPSVRVIYPNGGEEFATGVPVVITYEAYDEISGITSVNVNYSYNNGATWVSIVSGVSNTGICNWTTPDIASNQFLISVEAINGSSEWNCDKSDRTFTVPLPIVYISPDGSDITGTGKFEAPLRTVNRGLHAVAPTGEVRMLSGTYTIEASEYQNRSMAIWPDRANITLKASDETCICTIDAQDLGRCISITYEVNASIEGITFQNGNITADGSAIFCSNESYSQSTTTLKNVSVSNCRFVSNYVDSPSGWGGTVYVRGYDTRFTRCIFDQNSSDSTHNSAAGLIVESGFYPSTTGICSTTLTNCLFYKNIGGWGGGATLYYNKLVTVESCTFLSNEANEPDQWGWGGGLYTGSVPSGYNTFVNNSIFWGNTAYNSSTSQIYDENDVGSTKVTYSDVQGGASGIAGPVYLLEGSIEADPLFASTTPGDSNFLNLMGGSPCIDTATKEGTPSNDYAGKARPHGFGYDMGAYEFQGPSVLVLRPNGGEKAPANALYKITYKVSPDADYVIIMLSTDEGTNWDTPVTEEVGSHIGLCTTEWTVPNIIATQCLISVEARHNSVWNYDTSNATFEILADIVLPIVTVEAPNGGETYHFGQKTNIKWKATDDTELAANPITLWYSTDEGAAWTNIISNITNSGSYSWSVPSIEASKYLVSVEAKDTSNNVGRDTSNSTFEVTQLSIIYVSTDGSDESGTGTIEAPFKTVQIGLNNVKAGGEVRLKPGNYQGTNNRNLSWPNKNNITLKLSPEAVGIATIDAQSAARIITLEAAVNLTIEGITLKNGYVDGNGGAISLPSNAKLWLNKDIFRGNYVSATGSGCAVYAPSDNTAVITATNCKFVSNGSGSNSRYGGVAAYGKWIVSNSVFYSNYVRTLSSNAGYGGVAYNCTWTSTNCVYYSNGARNGGVAYGGSWVDSNSIYWANTGTSGPVFSGPSPLSVRYSDLQSNAGVSGTGNISSDPKFISVANEYDPTFFHVNPNTSPCIDVGTNEAGVPSTDGDGKPRPHNWISDMGAFETQAPKVTVTSLNSGESIIVGDPITITWTATDDYGLRVSPNPITIKYSNNSGATWTLITYEPNTGIYTWETESPDTYWISVEAVNTSNESNSDTTNNAFYVSRSIIYVSATTGSDETGTGTVEAPFKTLQRGLNAVAATGEVRMMPGTYSGTKNYNVSWPNKTDITLNTTPDSLGNSGPVTVDAGTSGRIITVSAGINITIEGISFINGKATNTYGSGIYLPANTKLWLNNDTFKSCTTNGYSGGAIYCPNTTDYVFVNKCRFISNNTLTGGSGGYGGAIFNGNVSAVNSLFYNNSSTYGGAKEDGTIVATNCVFAYNSASTAGGAIDYCRTSTKFFNCIFWGNSAPNGKVFSYMVTTAESSDIQSDGMTVYNGSLLVNHCVSSNPNFVSTSDASSAFLQIGPGTSCIDGGTSEGAPSDDIVGNARPRNFYYDIGAYEFDGPSVRVITPNGGSAYDAGSDVTITWTATDEYGLQATTPITINYSTDEGSNWVFITTEANTGIYTWETPMVVSELCLVSIEVINSSSEWNCDASDSTFTISNLAIVYVDPVNGSDSGTGTAESPFLTIQHGLDNVTPHGQVRLFAGTFSGSGNKNLSWPNKAGIMLKSSNESSVCTIDAQGSGRIISSISAAVSLTIESVTMQNAYLASGYGACINLLSGARLWLTDVTIKTCTNDTLTNIQGAMIYSPNNSTYIYARDSIFIDNSVNLAASGGVSISGEWSAVNCIFSNNRSGWGGVMYRGKWTATNCTFSGNIGFYGGGVFAGENPLGSDKTSSFKGTNCIFWGNGISTNPGDGALGTVFAYMPTPEVYSSDVQPDGWSNGWWKGIKATNCISIEPNLVSTPEENYRLGGGSPCIDKGTSSGAPSDDLDGNSRPRGLGYDMGAYEFQGPSMKVIYPNGGEEFAPETFVTISWEAIDEVSPITQINLSYSYNGGITWVPIVTNTPNDGSYLWTTPDIASDQFMISIDAFNGDSVWNCDASDGTFTVPLHTVYVSPTGSDITGTGKLDAPLKTIRKGLRSVQAAGEVMLLPGTHTMESSSYVNGSMVQWPSKEGITLKLSPEAVGIATVDAQSFGRMFTLSYPVDLTIESISMVNGAGATDIGGGVIYSTVTNEIHLINVYCSNNGTGVFGNGVGGVIRGGYVNVIADNSIFYDNGGHSGGVGAVCNWTATGCTFEHNSAHSVGCVAYGGTWNIKNCTFAGQHSGYVSTYGGIAGDSTFIVDGSLFENNQCIDGGVGSNSNWTITNSTFRNNHASNYDVWGGTGGVMLGCIVTVSNSTFEGNHADKEGGVFKNGTINASGCTFSLNIASGYYGGVVSNATLTATNCVFSKNKCFQAVDGGGVARSGTVKAYNCTFYGNTAESGGVAHSTTWTDVNSIYWGNSATNNPLFYNMTPTITYSNMQTNNWIGGTGNTSFEPRFFSTAEGSEDLRLGPGSRCMDQGTSEGAPSTDKNGKKRPHGFGIDMGAYEFQGPSIRVVIPNGGQIYYDKTYMTITWSSSDEGGFGPAPLFHINFSSDEGASWTPVTSGTPNTGIFTWEVPAVESSQCLISIDAFNASSEWNYDVSDATFEVLINLYPPALVTADALPVESPTYVRIRWTASTAEAFIGYYIYRGLTYETYDEPALNYPTPTTELSYDDSTVSTGEDYFYAVKTVYTRTGPYSRDASAPLLIMIRTVTVEAPSGYITNGGGTHDAVPGAIIKYTMKYENIGFAPATNIIINDKIPNYTSYKMGSATGEAVTSVKFSDDNGANWTYVATGEYVDENVNKISLEAESLYSGLSKLCTYEVVIK